MRGLMLLVLLIACGTGKVSGGVITGHEYYELGEEYQSGYIHAFVDSLLINKPIEHWASVCILSGLMPWQIGDLLDEHLTAHHEERHRPIQITLGKVLAGACENLGYK